MKVLLGAIIALILIVFVISFFSKKKDEELEDEVIIPDASCCGAHEVCEADSLMNHSQSITYFDDEELDRFKGKSVEAYNTNEVNEFQDILLTLKEYEVGAWLKSLQLRNIEVPLDIREEALLIISERRFGN